MTDKRTAQATRDDDDELDRHIEPESTPEDDAADSFLTDFIGMDSVEVKVYAQAPGGRKLEYLFDTTPEHHTMGQLLNILRDKYGGGDFRIHVRKDKQLVGNKAFSVRAPLPSDNKDNTREMMTEFRRELEDRERKQENGLASVLQAMQQNTQSMMMQMQTSQMEMMKLMLGNKSDAPRGMDLSDPNTLMALKELFSPPQKESGEMDTFMKAAEFLRSMQSDREPTETDVMLQAIRAIGPGLAQLAGGAARGALPAPESVRPMPGTAPGDAAPQPAASAPQGDAGEPLDVQGMVAQLFAAAARGDDAVPYAGPVIDRLGPDQAYAIFSTAAGRAQIFELVPDARKFEPWLKALGAAIDRETSDPDSGETDNVSGHNEQPGDGGHAGVDSGRGAGNPGDAKNHGEDGGRGENGRDS